VLNYGPPVSFFLWGLRCREPSFLFFFSRFALFFSNNPSYSNWSTLWTCLVLTPDLDGSHFLPNKFLLFILLAAPWYPTLQDHRLFAIPLYPSFFSELERRTYPPAPRSLLELFPISATDGGMNLFLYSCFCSAISRIVCRLSFTPFLLSCRLSSFPVPDPTRALFSQSARAFLALVVSHVGEHGYFTSCTDFPNVPSRPDVVQPTPLQISFSPLANSLVSLTIPSRDMRYPHLSGLPFPQRCHHVTDRPVTRFFPFDSAARLCLS